MTNELHEILERFNALPDDAILPSRVTGIILGVTERTIRYHPHLPRVRISRGLRAAGRRYSQALPRRNADRGDGGVMGKRSCSVKAEELTGLTISLPIPEVTAGNDEIVRLASLTRKAKFTDQEQAELDRASDFDRILVAMASNLLDGKRFSVCSDSHKTLDRVRSLAQHLGASVNTEFHDRLAGKPAIVFDPPPRQ